MINIFSVFLNIAKKFFVRDKKISLQRKEFLRADIYFLLDAGASTEASQTAITASWMKAWLKPSCSSWPGQLSYKGIGKAWSL